MIKDLEQFKMDLSNFYKAVVVQEHSKLVKRITIRLHQAIVAGCPENPLGTPVDTGWARANWGVVLGRSVPTEPVGEHPVEGSPVLPVNEYFKDIVAIVETGREFPFYWVYNNVPYIEALEDGHSTQQAPTGMVANALNAVQTFIDKL